MNDRSKDNLVTCYKFTFVVCRKRNVISLFSLPGAQFLTQLKRGEEEEGVQRVWEHVQNCSILQPLPERTFQFMLLWSSLMVIFDIIIIRAFDDSSVCSLFFSWFKFRHVWVWESRSTNICVNRFLSVITFLMGLSTEVSSSLGFNWVW